MIMCIVSMPARRMLAQRKDLNPSMGRTMRLRFCRNKAGALLHGDEADAFGDAGYQGVHKRGQAQGPRWHVAMRPGKRRQLDCSHPWARMLEQAEQLKASVRAKVEHPFHVIKNLFRHKKVRYKGLAKNQAQLFSLFGLANLVIAKRPLLLLHARGAS